MAYRKDYSLRHHGIHIYDPQTFEVGVANGPGFFLFFFLVVVSLFRLFYFIYKRAVVDSGRGQPAQVYS